MERFRDEVVNYHGVVGEHLAVTSGNPVNYHQVISNTANVATQEIDTKLFLAGSDSPQPIVMVVPGSLGVGPNHRAHAESLVSDGISVCLVDPFGARSVTSTVADQTHYSFAASAFDVLAVLSALAADPRIDSTRISAQGHSRGGSAVLTAAMRRFADPVVGPDVGLAGCYAVYPWCGHMFADANVGTTTVRSIVGDLDDWLSPLLVQTQVLAIANAGGDATVRVVPGARHSFDRLQELEELTDASVAPNAPVVVITDDGQMDSPYFDGPSADLVDRDVFVAAAKAGHGKTGATIGSTGNQPELFRADMFEFHRQVFTQ